MPAEIKLSPQSLSHLNSAYLSTLPPNTAILTHFIFTKSFSGMPCMGFPGDAELMKIRISFVRSYMRNIHGHK